MGKTGIIAIRQSDLIVPINFKKLLLLFNKLIVDINSIEAAERFLTNHTQNKSELTALNLNKEGICFLEKKGILSFMNFNESIISMRHEDEFILSQMDMIVDRFYTFSQAGKYSPNFNY